MAMTYGVPSEKSNDSQVSTHIWIEILPSSATLEALAAFSDVIILWQTLMLTSANTPVAGF